MPYEPKYMSYEPKYTASYGLTVYTQVLKASYIRSYSYTRS